MSIIKKILVVSNIALFAGAGAVAQVPDPPVADTVSKYANSAWMPSLVKDGVIERVEHEYRVQPWKTIRENDVAWQHRVWKQISVKEKMNAPFLYAGDEYTNGGAFIEILNHAIRTKQITAYSSLDDRFTIPIKAEDLDDILGIGVDTTWTYDPETQEEVPVLVNNTFNVASVTRYLIKEDWIFDRNSGRVQKFIIGIAPIMEVYNKSDGRFEYSQTLYWIQYPNARQVLGQYEVYNSRNMVKRMTWTDYLEGGYYSGVVYKYSKNNPMGKNLYQIGDVSGQGPNKDFRGLVEGQRAMEDLMNQELDMWER